MNSFTFFYIILPIVLALVLWLLLFFSYQKNKKLRGVSSGLGLALYLISAPENIKAQEGDEIQALKNFITQMEQFLSGLVIFQRKGLAEKLWGNPSFALEIASHNRGSEIFFYIAFPRMYENLLANQLHGAFPEAKIEKKNLEKKKNREGGGGCGGGYCGIFKKKKRRRRGGGASDNVKGRG